MTVHWISESTLQRKSAMLCLRRLTGRHTYDVLAKAVVDVLNEFGIAEKVTRITTDNGSNFRKAFSVFGETGAQPAAPRAEPHHTAGRPTFNEGDQRLEASQVQGISQAVRDSVLSRRPVVKLSNFSGKDLVKLKEVGRNAH